MICWHASNADSTRHGQHDCRVYRNDAENDRNPSRRPQPLHVGVSNEALQEISDDYGRGAAGHRGADCAAAKIPAITNPASPPATPAR